jgi:hypothetical protein
MFRFVQARSRGPFVLLVVMAMALSACSGGSSTAAPGGSSSPQLSPVATENGGSPVATSNGSNGGGAGIGGAANALAGVNSYKFSMTLAGSTVVSNLAMLPGSSIEGNGPVTLNGTIELKPDKGADINVEGFHLIETGGYDYFDTGGGGGFLKIQSSTSLADSFSPAQMFSDAIAPSLISGFDLVGTEIKDGVSADHYQASSSALAELGSITGVTATTWAADVWIAADGGYPVSMAIVATASDNSVVYEVQFDLTNVNDPANQVTAPTNVTGE